MNLQTLYNKAKPILEEDKLLNKYTYLAYHDILEGRYLSVNDLPNLDTKLASYIAEHSKVIIFPSYVNGEILSMVVRPMVTTGVPLTVGSSNLPFYIGNIRKDFKYGDPIILVEGIGDVGGLKLIYPELDIIPLNSSSLAKHHYEVIASLTHNVILIPDNDKAGKSNAYKMKKEFAKYDISLQVVPQLNNFKDTGEVVDLLIKYSKNKNQHTKEQINIFKLYYTAALSTVINKLKVRQSNE